MLNTAEVINSAFGKYAKRQNQQHEAEIQQDDNRELFEYLLHSILTGGAYARLWPNVRNYCKQTLPAAMFEELEQAYYRGNYGS